MDARLTSDNPYSRLMALKSMGVVADYASIRSKCVIVVGMGGVGSVAAEMLCRCGVGKLILFDYDRVELANMNRLFYRPEQVGLLKVQAAALTLKSINPDVDIEAHETDVTDVDFYAEFRALVSGSCVDLLLCCVDNYTARIAINRLCLSTELPWIESGVSENAVSAHMQFVLPGKTACFECAPPLIVESGVAESTLKREGVCAASLPTTMGIIAGLLVQNALKFLLKFGKVTPYLGYNALKDFFPIWDMKPNPHCANTDCIGRQQSAPEFNWEQNFSFLEEHRVASVEHQDNEWGISVEESSFLGDSPQEPGARPSEQETGKADDESLEHLMEEFEHLQS